MKQEYYKNRVSSEYIIITRDEKCEIVTKELEISPSRFFNKNDIITSRYSNRVGVKPHGLWAIGHSDFSGENFEIGRHIEYYQKLLSGKLEIINRLKNEYKFDCIFSISFETEDAGYSFDLMIDQLNFINKISTRFSCYFITKENL